MLVEIAIGDAYGAGFEMAPIEKVRQYNHLNRFICHPLEKKAGRYTDDTQMSLAIAELMIEKLEWNPENLANKFVACFKRDQRVTYAKGFHAFLKSVNSGREFLHRIKANSVRNGAAMRASPLGYIRDIPQLLHMASLQASLTHNTNLGIKSSQAVALAAHYFLYQCGAKEQLVDFVSQYSEHTWRDDWQQPVDCCAEETVNAVLTSLKESSSLKQILLNSVDFSGDVDSVAAIALGLASLSAQFRTNLPSFLYTDLENGEYGKSYLMATSKKLNAAYPRQKKRRVETCIKQ